jgi:hypothetical protein
VKKPVIGTIQANRAAGKNVRANSEEIAFSDALAQDATLFARVIQEPTHQNIAVVVGGARESLLQSFRIHGKCAQDFSFIGVIDNEEDIEGADKDKKKKGQSEERAGKVARAMAAR